LVASLIDSTSPGPSHLLGGYAYARLEGSSQEKVAGMVNRKKLLLVLYFPIRRMLSLSIIASESKIVVETVANGLIKYLK
jgi:hypothetical protein